MRVAFDTSDFQHFSFSVGGKSYLYGGVKRLAVKPNLDANIEETVVETPDGAKVWLTVVGAEDEVSAFGIRCGWYVAKVLDDDSAKVLIKAFAPWSA